MSNNLIHSYSDQFITRNSYNYLQLWTCFLSTNSSCNDEAAEMASKHNAEKECVRFLKTFGFQSFSGVQKWKIGRTIWELRNIQADRSKGKYVIYS